MGKKNDPPAPPPEKCPECQGSGTCNECVNGQATYGWRCQKCGGGNICVKCSGSGQK